MHMSSCLCVSWLSSLYARGQLSFACATHRSCGPLCPRSCGLEGSQCQFNNYWQRCELGVTAHPFSQTVTPKLWLTVGSAIQSGWTLGAINYPKLIAPAVADPAAVPEPAAVRPKKPPRPSPKNAGLGATSEHFRFNLR